jgi:hypothetical protein
VKRFIWLVVSLFISCAAVFGQPESGILRGKVTDTAGAVVLGASVSITGIDRKEISTNTGDNGEFRANLRPGKYAVRVTSPGFATYENNEVAIVAGRTVSLDITLGITLEETQVIVGDEPSVSTDPQATAGALILKESDIESLPDDRDELEAALQALAGPGAGPNGGEISIDGFSGGRLPPRDTIREIRINQNPFSSEYDRLGLGRIEILTKPGTDKFRGETALEFEDESLNSRNPFAPNRAPFQIRNINGNLGGPLIKQRASFFLDIEYEEVDNNALINARILDPGLTAVPFSLAVLAPSKNFEFSPRVDLKINNNNTLVGRYSFERSKAENAGLGGFDLLSRAYSTQRSEQTVRLTETAVISGTIINEARFQYIRRRNEQEAGDNSPTIRVLDAFTGGGANIGQAFSNEDRLEFQNYTSYLSGNHYLKFGLRLRHNNLRNASPGNFAGTFTFTSLDQYRATILNEAGAVPAQFSIAGGNPQASLGQSDIGVFLQDDWRVNPALTLSLGLRYENQTNIKSDLNFAPRIALAYAPGANGSNRPKTVFRGGLGIFYDRFGEGLTLNAVRFNGINQQQFVVTDAAILDPIIFTQNGVSNVPTVQQLAAFAQPQTTRIVANDLSVPYTIQTALSVERQLPFKTTVSATYVNAQIRRFLRSRNINAPVNGVRPNPAAGNIFQYESTGRFSQNQLIFNFRSNFMEDVSIFANYSFGGAKSDSDGAGTFPANQYDVSGEYGNSLSDVRHRLTVGSSFTVPWGVRLSPFITYRSGVPFNITTGIDNNGDTLFTDRPAFATDPNRQCDFGTPGNPAISACVVRTPFGDFDRQPSAGQTIIPRNYGRGSDFFNVNLRATKTFGFGGKKTDKPAASPGGGGGGGGNRGGVSGPFGGAGQRGGDDDEDSPYNLEFSINIRNIFNRTNKGTPVGNLRSPFFGQPISLAGGSGFGGGGSQAAGNRRVELEVNFSF